MIGTIRCTYAVLISMPFGMNDPDVGPFQIHRVTSVVNFKQLLVTVNTQKLVELLFFSHFQPFSVISRLKSLKPFSIFSKNLFSSLAMGAWGADLKIKMLKINKKTWFCLLLKEMSLTHIHLCS